MQGKSSILLRFLEDEVKKRDNSISRAAVLVIAELL